MKSINNILSLLDESEKKTFSTWAFEYQKNNDILCRNLVIGLARSVYYKKLIKAGFAACDYDTLINHYLGKENV